MDMKVTPHTIQAQTVERLRFAILTGLFKPGQRLTEAALCQITNVSRTSVREALRRLEGEKLVVMEPNKGPSVAELTWDSAEEIFKVRALLESEAAALFANRATADEIHKMQRALSSYAKAAAKLDTVGRLRATKAFYDVLHEGCGNGIIREILEGLHARISLLRSRSMSRPGRSRYSLSEMRAILSTIQDGDPTAARRATLLHIDAACAAVREAYLADAQERDSSANNCPSAGGGRAGPGTPHRKSLAARVGRSGRVKRKRHH